ELPNLNERAASVRHAEPLLGAAVGAAAPAFEDQRAKRLARGPPTESLAEIHAARGVEAEVPHAVGGEPAAIAGSAERRGGGRDDPEHVAVGQPETVGGSGAVFLDGLDGAVALAEPVQYLRARDHAIHRPLGGTTHIHVLDEPDLGLRAACVLDQRG